ncbi:carbohydrate ABC transporter substrate-binding protein [Ponticoccus sp. SC2-23]|uniref:ABC transporter substrate-binding protein n=1 Tax=Alexandriicola marinus TaxID=2081710 RepID=UPI000FDBDABC|nr:ABC transporter substrate-binding protein [Alexandriicola marinus]MBM1218966.1 carbohydrate ABC transporter substrate-binding protein [Ponticoccus sp. SC6-9]MBM1223962.1 carbohydrate ABC transporter substrate-binding protein [Ponticoccus sp. SC6-15]MBM1230259.1 carbohydrate ABC transporter substrate-binding protein [Ponticoccus sp. SC6-38]MBM1232928.1 carbohydrate ABC transporter substrate-binding protein [Ponticoccus sp. SC6-45]MBM1237122.1 carbohydrate ABC transporter substrate-binding pr
MKLRAKILSGAAMALVLASGAQAETLRFWTTEEQPERLARQEQMAADFAAATGHTVEVIPVSENDLGTRTTAAFAAGDLPDVIYHTLQYALPWAEAGILDTDAATDVVEALGADTFAPGALNMASFDGGYASVPVDGWTQMIVYRADLFEENGLEPPNSYANVLAAVDALHNPPEMYGFVAATKVDENFMSQVLEHVFLANGVSPVGPDGFEPLDEAATIEVLEFYKAIAEASPPGDLFWDQSRTLYFSGNAAMIIWSPFILDELAGLRDSAPPTINDDPTSSELASKTGIVTNFAGPSNPDGAAWGDVRYFGITSDAATDAAMEFVEYSMGEGYGQTLAIAPEGKFPVRRGTADDPTAFSELWSTLDVGVDRKAPLGELYDAAMINEIVGGLDVAQRWGVNEGQLSLASSIINSQVINRLVREYIDGERDAAATVAALNDELAAIQ